MNCPSIGTWRAWLDGEVDARDLAAHLTICPACRELLHEVRTNATALEQAFGTLEPAPDSVEMAHQRLLARLAAGTGAGVPSFLEKEKAPMQFPLFLRRWKYALAGAAAAVVVGVVAVTPWGQTAAAQFLSQFRSERFAIVTIDPNTQQDMFDDLEKLGTFTKPQNLGRSTDVGSLDEAAKLAGFPLKALDPSARPTVIGDSPNYEVMPGSQMRFTFDKQKAADYFKSIGKPGTSLPDKFNGATLVVNVPTVVLAQYGQSPTKDQRNPGPDSRMMVVQAKALTAHVEGQVSLEELRDFLLGLPGLSPATANQFRNMQDWWRTIPIPVPVGQMSWKKTAVDGAEAYVFTDQTAQGSAVLWQRDGMIYGVMLTGTEQEAISADLPASADVVAAATVAAVPAIEVVRLRKLYGRRAALDDLSLAVQPGEVFGFLGPNGAGKTTTIKILLGLVKADSGEARLFGVPVTDPAARRRAGYLPELFRFHEWMTGEMLLDFHGRLSGMALADRRARIPEVLDMVGLTGRGKDRVRGYSKGMTQRLGLAQALIHRPDVVLLDEPTSALDPIGRREVRDIIRILKEAGTTVFLNSHLLSEIELVCDRVAIVDKGKVIRVGPLGRLMDDGSQEIRIAVDRVDSSLLAALGHYGDATDVSATSLTLVVESLEVAPSVADAIHAEGRRLYELTPRVTSLEDVFVRLVESTPS